MDTEALETQLLEKLKNLKAIRITKWTETPTWNGFAPSYPIEVSFDGITQEGEIIQVTFPKGWPKANDRAK